MANGTDWDDENCHYMPGNKTCGNEEECLLCQDGGIAEQLKRHTNQINKTVYLSSSCHHVEQLGPLDLVYDLPLALSSRNQLRIVGPGQINSPVLKSKIVEVQNVHVRGHLTVEATNVAVETVRFLECKTNGCTLLLQNAKNIEAAVSDISLLGAFDKRPDTNKDHLVTCANLNGGTVTIDTAARTRVLVQDSNAFPRTPVEITGGNITITNITHDLNIYSMEYEVRYYHNGLYTKTVGVPAEYYQVVILLFFALIIALPLCHRSVWHNLVAVMRSKKVQLKNL